MTFQSAGITDIITHRDANNAVTEIEVQLEILDDDDALGGRIEKDENDVDVRKPGQWTGTYRFVDKELALLLTLNQSARRDAIVARMKDYLKERYRVWKQDHNVTAAPIPEPTKTDVSNIPPFSAADVAAS